MAECWIPQLHEANKGHWTNSRSKSDLMYSALKQNHRTLFIWQLRERHTILPLCMVRTHQSLWLYNQLTALSWVFSRKMRSSREATSISGPSICRQDADNHHLWQSCSAKPVYLPRVYTHTCTITERFQYWEPQVPELNIAWWNLFLWLKYVYKLWIVAKESRDVLNGQFATIVCQSPNVHCPHSLLAHGHVLSSILNFASDKCPFRAAALNAIYCIRWHWKHLPRLKVLIYFNYVTYTSDLWDEPAHNWTHRWLTSFSYDVLNGMPVGGVSVFPQ